MHPSHTGPAYFGSPQVRCEEFLKKIQMHGRQVVCCSVGWVSADGMTGACLLWRSPQLTIIKRSSLKELLSCRELYTPDCATVTGIGKEFPKVNLDVASLFWRIVFHGKNANILSNLTSGPRHIWFTSWGATLSLLFLRYGMWSQGRKSLTGGALKRAGTEGKQNTSKSDGGVDHN